jgi:CBS domain-containing protein
MTEPLLKLADTPATSVAADATVKEAVQKMVESRVGAVAVIGGDALEGIFTERDLMVRVVDAGLDPASTPVGDVMVRRPVHVTPGTPRSEALELMLKHHFRHLPLVDENGKTLGMLSIRNLLSHQVRRLHDSVTSLEQYIAADGPGG